MSVPAAREASPLAARTHVWSVVHRALKIRNTSEFNDWGVSGLSINIEEPQHLEMLENALNLHDFFMGGFVKPDVVIYWACTEDGLLNARAMAKDMAHKLRSRSQMHKAQTEVYRIITEAEKQRAELVAAKGSEAEIEDIDALLAQLRLVEAENDNKWCD